MKKYILCCLFIMSTSVSVNSQEWMTSLEIAERMALTQGKFLFVVWEDASYDPYPVLIFDEKKRAYVDDMFANETINETIWEYFVPVILSESKYEELFYKIQGKRSVTYIDKFNDDSIKIMDINGNIVNTIAEYYDYLDIAKFIERYALDTSFLEQELRQYRAKRDFNTSFRLAAKYIDYAILIKDEKVRSEIISVSNFYLVEAQEFLSDQPSEKLSELEQKLAFQNMKQQLVLDKAKKVQRRLKRTEPDQILESNKELWAFLQYTTYLLLGDEEEAETWRNELSLVNLTKANRIRNNN